MKKIYTTILVVAMMFGMQSSVMAETYQAWGAVLFSYVTSPMYDAGESIEVTSETIKFHSDTWGDGSFAAANGEGTLTMAGHGGAKDYAANITGSVESSQFVISVPAVMGGVTVMFNPADFEEVMLTAGVKTISTANTDAPVYDLKGRRVGTNYKGIVIKNGKKYYQK